MVEEKFVVQNVKCDGCASAIQDALNKLAAVQNTQVDIEAGTVRVEGDGLDRDLIATTLQEIGYPEL